MPSISENTDLINSRPQRHDFLDVAKGIGILLVVFAHINYTPFLLTTIYSFHMPLFFFLSGMVFDSRRYANFGSFIKRKVQTLLCPYVLFFLIAVFCRLLVQIVADANNINWQEFSSYFGQMFLSQGSLKQPNTPLWFVPCLMLLEIIYFWLSKCRKLLIVVVSVLLTFAGWLLDSGILLIDAESLPWSFDSAFFAIGFFALGNLLSKHICTIPEKINGKLYKKFLCAAIFLLIWAILIPLAIYNGKVSIGSKELKNGFIFYATGILGTLAILLLSIILKKNKFFEYCGKNSFTIMGIHWVIIGFLKFIYEILNIPIYDNYIFIETIVPIILVIFACLLFVVFYNKVKTMLKYHSKAH